MYSFQQIAKLEQVTPLLVEQFLRKFPVFDRHISEDNGVKYLSENGFVLLKMVGYQGWINTYHYAERQRAFEENMQTTIKTVLNELK